MFRVISVPFLTVLCAQCVLTADPGSICVPEIREQKRIGCTKEKFPNNAGDRLLDTAS